MNLSYYKKNKQKLLKKAKTYYINNKEKILNRQNKKSIALYFPNLTIDEALLEYEKLVKKQNNLCALCSKAEKIICYNKIRKLSIDHCHKTGKVRGLLCFECNTSLGKLEPFMNKLITYLEYK